MTFSGYGHSCGWYHVDKVGCECFSGMDALTLEKVTMSFAEEMRRKSLEAQRIAAEKARLEEIRALELQRVLEEKKRVLEESKRNNCIPDLKKQIQEAASSGLREVNIKYLSLPDTSYRNYSATRFLSGKEIENMEWNSFWEMYSSDLDEYDRMRIAFIKSEPGLSLTRVVETHTHWPERSDDGPEYRTWLCLKVVW